MYICENGHTSKRGGPCCRCYVQYEKGTPDLQAQPGYKDALRKALELRGQANAGILGEYATIYDLRCAALNAESEAWKLGPHAGIPAGERLYRCGARTRHNSKEINRLFG